MPMTKISALMTKLLSVWVLAVMLFTGIGAAQTASAADLPLAAGSPLVGFTFDDKPLLLPVQRNFQMAMLTASSELRRSCGKMEAYGWRMGQSEQDRVNQIFNATVDRLRALGFVIEAKSSDSVSNDVTLFTADRQDRHFLFMWSAGEIGLVMSLCESSAPIDASVSPLPKPRTYPQDVMKSRLETPAPAKLAPIAAGKFLPIGQWVGNYTCAQGYTGATLQINRLDGERFDGEFRFYPTPHNPAAPAGRFTVNGQYDRESQRILINPVKWIQQPKGFLNTVMVGSFDPSTMTFSAYFQGLTGCTSFEARNTAGMVASEAPSHATAKPAHKAKKEKNQVKKPVVVKPKKAAVREEKVDVIDVVDDAIIPAPAPIPAGDSPLKSASKDSVGTLKEPSAMVPSVPETVPAVVPAPAAVQAAPDASSSSSVVSPSAAVPYIPPSTDKSSPPVAPVPASIAIPVPADAVPAVAGKK